MEFPQGNDRKGVTKGIIFAADSGTELYPMAQVIAKQLLPVHDKPMVYYPLSTLMLAGIRDILIMSSPRELRSFMELLGNGSRLGVRISYAEQAPTDGIAQSFLTAERFIGDDSVCLIPGDSIFCGDLSFLRQAFEFRDGAMLFARRIAGSDDRPLRRNHNRRVKSASKSSPAAVAPRHGNNMARYRRPAGGCHAPEQNAAIEFDRAGKALRLEKGDPSTPCEYAIAGFYIFENKSVEVAKSLQRETSCADADVPPRCAPAPFSAALFDALPIARVSTMTEPRRQPDIMDLSREYLLRGELQVVKLDGKTTWLDAGTQSGLLEASSFIAAAEKRQGVKIACIEEVAFRMGFIGAERLRRLFRDLPAGNSYREYLESLARTSADEAQRDASGSLHHRPAATLVGVR